jgi:acylglycerol lipase
LRHLEDWLQGAGGLRIYWQAWLPDSEARASVVLAHGAAEHSGRYAHVGRALGDAGYALYALDHRGHGRSEGRRANIGRIEYVVSDLLSLIDLVTGRDGGRRPYLLGHSMGGAVAIACAVEHQDSISGLLVSGALASNEAAPAPTRALARVASALIPNLGAYAIDPEAVSRDPEVVRSYEADPLNHHGKLPARTVGELISTVGRFPEQLPSLHLPLLVMHGGADRLIPVAGSRMVAELAGSEDETLIVYDGLYHEILNEPERDRVIADVVRWLDDRAGGRAA